MTADLDAAIDVPAVYAEWPDKGRPVDGRRLTIIASAARLRAGESVAILHVYEVMRPGVGLYVMGPKPVFGEELDGQAATPTAPSGEDPLAPGLYDGPVIPSPGIDYNFETTSYSFPRPGRHQLIWRVGDLVSNALTMEVSGGAVRKLCRPAPG